MLWGWLAILQFYGALESKSSAQRCLGFGRSALEGAAHDPCLSGRKLRGNAPSAYCRASRSMRPMRKNGMCCRKHCNAKICAWSRSTYASTNFCRRRQRCLLAQSLVSNVTHAFKDVNNVVGCTAARPGRAGNPLGARWLPAPPKPRSKNAATELEWESFSRRRVWSHSRLYQVSSGCSSVVGQTQGGPRAANLCQTLRLAAELAVGSVHIILPPLPWVVCVVVVVGGSLGL